MTRHVDDNNDMVQAKQFAENVQIFCSETKFNAQIKNGLFAILFQTSDEIIKDSDKVQMVSFYKPFVHPPALKALFYALKGADFDLRRCLTCLAFSFMISTNSGTMMMILITNNRAALEDLNTTLIGSPANCNSLCEGKQWQEWVWNLLTDIPKDKEEEKAKKVSYHICISIIKYISKYGYMCTCISYSVYMILIRMMGIL
jgi:F420-dependent methylenetetrahydromethanopterin dehydrogenase